MGAPDSFGRIAMRVDLITLDESTLVHYLPD